MAGLVPAMTDPTKKKEEFHREERSGVAIW
jgi:hypothetical protein